MMAKELSQELSQEVASFEKKLGDFSDQFYGLLGELIDLRKQSPQIKAETAKLLEQYMITVSKQIKQISKENDDDLMEGISFLKIKLMS